jgi:hypothetical protein
MKVNKELLARICKVTGNDPEYVRKYVLPDMLRKMGVI